MASIWCMPPPAWSTSSVRYDHQGEDSSRKVSIVVWLGVSTTGLQPSRAGWLLHGSCLSCLVGIEDERGGCWGCSCLGRHRMGNLQKHGGPLPSSWLVSQFNLAKQIIGRMTELGIIPVLPAFTGFMPRTAPTYVDHDERCPLVNSFTCLLVTASSAVRQRIVVR